MHAVCANGTISKLPSAILDFKFDGRKCMTLAKDIPCDDNGNATVLCVECAFRKSFDPFV